MSSDYKVRVKTRTFCGSYDDFYDDEIIIGVPNDVNNVDGFLSFVVNTNKRKDEMVKILEYEELEYLEVRIKK